MKFIKMVVVAVGLMMSGMAGAGTVNWTFDIQIPTSNLGNSVSPLPAVFPCRSAIGSVTYTEGAQAHYVSQLLDANISVCGATYTEAELFGSFNFVGTRDPANSFNVNAFGFGIKFDEDFFLGPVARFFGTVVDGRNLWEQNGTASFTRVGVAPSSSVPLPASAALIGLGFFGLLYSKKKPALGVQKRS